MNILKIEGSESDIEFRVITDIQVRKHLVSRIGGLKYDSTTYLHTEDKIYTLDELMKEGRPKNFAKGDYILTDDDGRCAGMKALTYSQLFAELEQAKEQGLVYTFEEHCIQ